jgi:hypothetical protein
VIEKINILFSVMQPFTSYEMTQWQISDRVRLAVVTEAERAMKAGKMTEVNIDRIFIFITSATEDHRLTEVADCPAAGWIEQESVVSLAARSLIQV